MIVSSIDISDKIYFSLNIFIKIFVYLLELDSQGKRTQRTKYLRKIYL